jgi:hypothetical protein
MTINVLEWFQKEATRHAESLAAAQVTAARARTQLPTLEAELAAAKKALEDKRELKTRAEQEGLDTTKLNGTISELDAQFGFASARCSSCKAEIDAARPQRSKPFERELELARELSERHHIRHAVEIAELRDCYAHLLVKVSKEDPDGRPTEVEVRLGEMPRITVPVVNAQARVSAEFRPASLAWLTLKSSPLTATRSDVDAFLDTQRGVLVLATTRHDVLNYEQRSLSTDVAESLEDHIRERIGGLHGLDLERPYPENELVEVIRSKVLALTAATGPFRPSHHSLTSGEIGSSIKDDWAAFVACPWAADVRGPLALLKYHAENGEKPRYWSEEYEGHFGFRLRTRDHTWIVGELFIVPGEPTPSGRERMTVGRDGLVASLGRLHLKVAESR